ncbi:MAG: c-type cytochrome [Syntrophales bacterium]|nr:c-type cytochrome [Syntrophales bacterium]
MRKSIGCFSMVVVAVGLGLSVSLSLLPDTPAALAGEPQDGGKLYATHCGGCHPNGGNVINAGLPVAGSQKLKNLKTFTEFNRNPLKADGSKGMMPAFSKETISDPEMKQIYQYVIKMPPGKK